MKIKIIFSFFLIQLFLFSCKKDAEVTIIKNFIEINGDKRIFGSNLDLHLFIDHDMWDLEIYDTQYSKEIAGYPIDKIEIRILITDSNLLNNRNNPSNKDYPIVDLNNHQLVDYARISIFLSKSGQGQYYFNSFYPTGNLKVSEVKGRRVIEFSNIELLSGVLGDGSPIPVSGRFEL